MRRLVNLRGGVEASHGSCRPIASGTARSQKATPYHHQWGRIYSSIFIPRASPRLMSSRVSHGRVALYAISSWRGCFQRLATGQHQRTDQGSPPSDAGRKKVDHDDPAQALDTADGGDHAGQNVEAEQP